MKKAVKYLMSICLIMLFALAVRAAQMPAEVAGEIGYPTGKIAYLHDNDVWVMNCDGSHQFKVVSATNASGKLSWAPDGKRIAFSRRGSVKTETPDLLGGSHRIYDIFVGYLDSAQTNTNFWKQLTMDLGGRYPEWSADGDQIMFTNDLNARYANPVYPNYQTCFMDTSGQSYKILRRDYEGTEFYSLMPTAGPNRQIAYVLYQKVNPVGLVISTLDKKTFTAADLTKSTTKMIKGATGPAWSPDGKWIAYIDFSITNQAIHVVSPDLSQSYIVYKPTAGLNLQTYPLSWSPDSKWLTFGTSDGSIWIIDITGNQLRQISGPGLNAAPAWSKN